MNLKSSALKWIWQESKGAFPLVVLISLFNILISVLLILLASVSKSIIDSPDNIMRKGVFIIALVVLQLLLGFISSMINAKASGKLVIRLRNKIFSGLLHKKYADTEKLHSGDILNRMTSDVNIVVNGAITLIPSICSIVTKIIVAVYALTAVNLTVGLIVVSLGIIVPLFARVLGKKYKQIAKEVQKTEGLSRSFIGECLENSVVIKTFSGEESITDKMNLYLSKNYDIKIKHSLLKAGVNALLNGVFSVGYYIVIIWAVCASLSYGTLYYLLQLITILRSPLQNVSGILPKYYSMLASAERIMEFEELEDEPTPLDDDTFEILKENFKSIEIKNLGFSYGNEKILEDCTLTIPRNKLTVITGESGGGKSTLFKLLLGLYAQNDGFISFDEGTSIDATTRKMFAFVPQGNMILSGTIRENITLCNNCTDEEDIIKAAKVAQIYDFIESLPNGFNTEISEKGVGLSEGQIQRIAIARALLTNAPILLLDESTSALDEQLEESLLTALKSMSDRTVIFITHRNKPVDTSDAIFHLENKKFIKIK